MLAYSEQAPLPSADARWPAAKIKGGGSVGAMRWSAAAAWLCAALVGVGGDALGGLGQLLPPWLGGNLDEIVRAASETCEALPLDVLLSKAYVPDISVVQFQRHSQKSFSLSKAHLHLRDHWPPTLVVYIPGWWNTPADESSKTLVGALLNKNPYVLVLDTRLIFCKGYVTSAASVNSLGHRLYKFLKNMDNDGFPMSSVHLIGFSLGAHVAGIAGKSVQKHLNRKLDRITALDPARPCFARPSQYRLDKSDAKFVQVLHTSAGVLGLELPLGHIDVYANGVKIKQPECSDRSISLECDHAQAWRLFSASVMNDHALMGRRCKSWDELNRRRCTGNKTSVGYSCSTATRGMYLYKSTGREKEPQLKVFNPLDLSTWWAR
ncbi:unnamed protein product, partial [Iphiclides podalirius]